jgi:hypothetical protein
MSRVFAEAEGAACQGADQGEGSRSRGERIAGRQTQARRICESCEAVPILLCCSGVIDKAAAGSPMLMNQALQTLKSHDTENRPKVIACCLCPSRVSQGCAAQGAELMKMVAGKLFKMDYDGNSAPVSALVVLAVSSSTSGSRAAQARRREWLRSARKRRWSWILQSRRDLHLVAARSALLPCVSSAHLVVLCLRSCSMRNLTQKAMAILAKLALRATPRLRPLVAAAATAATKRASQRYFACVLYSRDSCVISCTPSGRTCCRSQGFACCRVQIGNVAKAATASLIWGCVLCCRRPSLAGGTQWTAKWRR